MRDWRSLLNFAILIVVAAATAGFVVNKASEAIAEIDALNTYPAFSVRQKAALDTSAGSTALTAGWKIYRDDEYGFEFKHPPNFGIEIGGNTKSELEMDKGKEISGRRAQLAIHPTNAGIGYFPTIFLIISSTPRVNYYGGILDKPLYIQGGFYYFPGVTEGKVGEFVTDILSTFKFIK